MKIREEALFHSCGIKASSLVKKDLDVIKFFVEEEFKSSIRTTGHSRKEVDVKKIFISLVINVYNKLQKKLGLPRVTLVSLARYLRYSSHSSVSLHYINSSKGYIAVEEYIMTDEKLKEKYLKLKRIVEKGNFSTFKKFLIAKKEKLLAEIAAIDKYLNKEHEETKEKETA